MGIVVAASLVDHVKPHRGDAALFWDERLWQPSCKWHHDVVKQTLEDMWMKGSISEHSLRLGSALAVDLARRLRGWV